MIRLAFLSGTGGIIGSVVEPKLFFTVPVSVPLVEKLRFLRFRYRFHNADYRITPHSFAEAGVKNGTRGRILGRNWDKSLKSFPPCY